MPDADWLNARSQFVGWVPNVLGHLSFSLIGRGTTPHAHCVCAEVDSVQEVVAFQTRQADDRALPGIVARWTNPLTVHDCLLVAKTERASYPSSKASPAGDPTLDIFDDERGMLRGRIVIYGSKRWSKTGFWKQLGFRWSRWRWRAKIIGFLRGLSRRDAEAASPVVSLEQAFASDLANHPEFAQIEFCLFRTGEARIWFQDEDAILFESDDAKAKEQTLRGFAKSAYFFLKDITHLHTHHHHSQDGMLPFCRLDRQGVAGEKDWQRRIMWALSRSIEEYVRRGTRADLKAATGILPYAENYHSLYGGLHREPGELHKFASIKDHEFDHYSFEGLRKMVASLLDARNSLLTVRAAMATAAIPITLSSVIAVNAVGTSKTADTHWPTMFKTIASAYPHAVVPVILVLMFLVYKIAYREAGQEDFLFAPVRTYTRIIKSLVVSINRRIGFPPIVGFLIVLLAQVAGLWAVLEAALCLIWPELKPTLSLIEWLRA